MYSTTVSNSRRRSSVSTAAASRIDPAIGDTHNKGRRAPVPTTHEDLALGRHWDKVTMCIGNGPSSFTSLEPPGAARPRWGNRSLRSSARSSSTRTTTTGSRPIRRQPRRRRARQGHPGLTSDGSPSSRHRLLPHVPFGDALLKSAVRTHGSIPSPWSTSCSTARRAVRSRSPRVLIWWSRRSSRSRSSRRSLTQSACRRYAGSWPAAVRVRARRSSRSWRMISASNRSIRVSYSRRSARWVSRPIGPRPSRAWRAVSSRQREPFSQLSAREIC